MKYFVCFVFLFCGYIFYGQNIEKYILLKDSTTDLPIAQAAVLAIDINKSGVTNNRGVFKLAIAEQVTLQIKHANYATTRIHSSLLTERLNVIYLNALASDSIEANEMAFDDSSNTMLVKLIENSKKALITSVGLKIYVVEFFKKNNVFTSFNDGLLNVFIKGKIDQIKADIVVEQNRLHSISKHTEEVNTMGYNLNTIIESNYNFNSLNNLLDAKNAAKYDYYYTTSSTNDTYYKIKIVLKKEINEPLLSYEIVYDYTKMLIVAVKSYMSEHALPYAQLKNFDLNQGQLLLSSFRANYKITDSLYHLSNYDEVIGIKMKTSDEEEDILEVKNYFLVDQVNTQPMAYDRKKVFKEKSLNKTKTKYNTNYWGLSSNLALTSEEIEIIQKLSSETLN